MMTKWVLVPIISAIFTILIGTLVPVLGDLDNKGALAAWILFMSIGGVVFCISVPHALIRHFFMEKQKLQKLKNDIELGNMEVVKEESELDKEISALEKQKKIAELKREINYIEELEEVASTSSTLAAEK